MFSFWKTICNFKIFNILLIKLLQKILGDFYNPRINYCLNICNLSRFFLSTSGRFKSSISKHSLRSLTYLNENGARLPDVNEKFSFTDGMVSPARLQIV